MNYFISGRKNQFYVLISIILAFISCIYATWTYRPELADGYRMVFNMMSGRPSHGYINYRQIQLVTQSIGYITPYLKSMHLSFSEIYAITNFFVAFFPVLIFLYTIGLVYFKKIEELMPFLCLNYAMSVLPTYSFHVSLVPESILFAWIAFVVWLYPPQSFKNWFYALTGLCALILYSTGYESTLIVFFIFLFHFLYSLKLGEYKKEKRFEFFYKVVFLAIAIFMIYYRLTKANTTGVFFMSLNYFLQKWSSAFLFLITSCLSLVTFRFVKKEYRNIIVIINFVLGIMIFFAIPYSALWDGFHMRIMSILSCGFLMLCALFHLKIKYEEINFQYLVLSIFMFNFIYDIRATQQWIGDRNVRKEELAKNHTKGCYALKHERWTINYESILFQATFVPEYIVVQLQDNSYFYPYQGSGDPCTFVPTYFSPESIPIGISGEMAIKTFSFEKIKAYTTN